MPGLRLKTYGTSELVNISRDFWRTLSQEVSSRSVGYLLLLAWNIRSPTTQGETVYTTDMYFRTGNDIQIDHLSDKVIATGTKELPDLKGIANEDLVKCSCYIAASLLRLFTKMPGTWELAYVKHLKEGYFKFYKEPYPILNFSPDGNCIEGICQTLQNVTIMKGTLGRFLYSYYYLEDGKGLCTMLFEQHIGLTGMHAFNLFLRVAISMNVTAKELTLACWHRMTKIPLGAIMDILSGPASEIGKAKSPNERGTWRYSRLFGNEYFMSIQSKHCGVLICTLAILCELMGQAGNQDIHKIASISRIPDEAKEQYRTWATRIHHFFTSSDDAAENNPFTKIVN
ncbi:TPA_asm: nucleocapsid protein [Cucumis virus 1]|uniref:Nucleoprotein n=1 Tax=Cucumis virus 1 TaxID=2977964 RepID=A0A9N6YJC3_9RHAB|nr:TPA_asm: nucleocapsid protein [Cucumis virus 1]